MFFLHHFLTNKLRKSKQCRQKPKGNIFAGNFGTSIFEDHILIEGWKISSLFWGPTSFHKVRASFFSFMGRKTCSRPKLSCLEGAKEISWVTLNCRLNVIKVMGPRDWEKVESLVHKQHSPPKIFQQNSVSFWGWNISRFNLSNEKWAPSCWWHNWGFFYPIMWGSFHKKPWHFQDLYHINNQYFMLQVSGCFFFQFVSTKILDTFFEPKKVHQNLRNSFWPISRLGAPVVERVSKIPGLDLGWFFGRSNCWQCGT